jgi:hypothetical protein
MKVIKPARNPKKQANSWFFQYASRFHMNGVPEVPGLVAQIYFPTDGAMLDEDDRAVLDTLIDSYKYRLMGDQVRLRFVGHADPRGTEAYNQGLGHLRAQSVKEYVDRRLHGYRQYGSSWDSRGKTEPTGDWAEDRRVDVFSSYVPPPPPIVFPDELVVGKYEGRLSRKFRFRTWGGISGGVGIAAGQIIDIQIENCRTKGLANYRYTGAGPAVSLPIGLNRWTDWEEKETPVFLDLADFEGNGKVYSVSGGVAGGTIMVFYGPKERRKMDKGLVFTFDGWDLNLGIEADWFGYWHWLH